jgi:retinol dehydrogenase-12
MGNKCHGSYLVFVILVFLLINSVSQGHWLFMQLLMPALERGALSSPDQRSRVVHTSSLAIYAGATISFDTLIPGPARNRKSRMDLHKQSKAANVVVTLEAVKRYAGKGVVFTATNPGFLKTEITRHETPMQRLSTVCLTQLPVHVYDVLTMFMLHAV